MASREMIERVARAIWEAQRARIKDQEGLNARLSWKSISAPEPFRRSYELDARAAIEAMREPTEAMGNAGGKKRAAGHIAPTIWVAMIDEVLQ